MAKNNYDPSWFMDVKKAADLKKLGDSPDPAEFGHAVFDIFKTPLLLRTMARALEKGEVAANDIMAKVIIERMERIVNGQTDLDSPPKK